MEVASFLVDVGAEAAEPVGTPVAEAQVQGGAAAEADVAMLRQLQHRRRQRRQHQMRAQVLGQAAAAAGVAARPDRIHRLLRATRS